MSANGLYDPDQNAVNTRWVQPWSEAYRAQRDVGLRVPINFQTMPAVSLTAACFSANRYEHNAFQKCFSNLLAVGFRKFTVDAYWDPPRQVWSLCPVQLPLSNGASSNNGDTPVSTGQTLVPSSDTVMAQAPQSTIPLPPGAQKRQETQTSMPVAVELSSATSPPVIQVSSSPTSSAASSAATPTIVEYPSMSGPPLLQIGNYNCTSLTTFDLLTGILADFLDSTSTTTGAALTLFAFNVHAASPIANPNGEAPNVFQDQLPKQGQLLSDLLRGNLSKEIYKPTLLSDQRANLNDSWFNVEWSNRPLEGYYQVSENAQGQLYTNSGWPTEAYMEFKQLFRLVASYGNIDTQMKEYNVAGDSDYIFPPNTILNQKAMTVSSDGRVTSGCLFNPSDETITSSSNSSWAISITPGLDVSSNPDLTLPIASIHNLTACGATPWLNETLSSTTADRNPLPYAAFVHSTLWGFAPGEPLNATQGDDQRTINRCVVMTKSPYPSRWRTTDCRETHRVACHDPSSPYAWRISSESSNYTGAETRCTPPYRFSVPHTALENAHLFAAFEALQSNRRDDDVLYVNLNSINTPDCWVVGLNSTCPYLPSTDTDRTRIVVVPTVAAVIIFLLAVMTFFLKCAANRRENKRGRKRRLVDGWEYEGVPS